MAILAALAPLRPSLVIGKLDRCKVDLARSREGSAEVEGARAAHDEYHAALCRCLDAAVAAQTRPAMHCRTSPSVFLDDFH